MKIIKDIFKKINKFRKTNPVEFWTLAAILVIAAICRLYKIGEYMTFLGDEGRDVIIVRRLLVEGHPPLIGPGTSIGNMYLGPLYYYMMAPALFLSGFSPVGPAIQIALLGIITVFFVWFVGREWFGKEAGIIAAGLYAISPTVITFSRSSWNPNIMPFFSLLTVYAIWKVWKEKQFKWLIVAGVSFAFVLQSHYLGLLLAPVIFVYYLITFLKIKSSDKDKAEFLGYSGMGLGLFLLLMSPLLIFDIRHGWMNTTALYKFFTVRQETVSIRPWSAVPKIPLLMTQIVTSLSGAGNKNLGNIITLIISATSLIGVWGAFKKRKSELWGPLTLMTLWFLFALIGFGVYKQNIYDHYFGFVFVLPFLFLGYFAGVLIKKRGLPKIAGIILLIFIVSLNLAKNPLKYSPNRQLQRAQNVAKLILSEDSDKPFDLAVLAERNYEDGYRYFLELWGAKVLHADRWNPASIADQLFVVCEMEEKKCDPTHSPKAEVANFGMSKIDAKWESDGVIIYRLLHST